MKKIRKSCTLLAALVLLAGCGAKNTEVETIIELTASALEKPQTVTVERGDMEMAVALDAYVGPKVVQLSFKEEGTFGEFSVGIGETVEKGDVLATPYTKELDEQVEAKQKELDELIAEYDYQKATMENNINIINRRMDKVNDQISWTSEGSPRIDQLEAQLRQYDEQKRRAELQLEHLTETYDLQRSRCEEQLNELKEKSSGNVITAPFDGVVVALADAEYGDAINSDYYYVAVADQSVLHARCAYVGQGTINVVSDVVFWKDGVEYPVSYVPMEEETYREMNNNQEDIYSEFVIEDATGAVITGDYGKIRLVVVQAEDVLMVPETVILTDAGNTYVYKDAEGKREKVDVEIGSKDGIYVEILEGLQEGDVVYVQE